MMSPKPPLCVGLTGNIGSGKSTVAARLVARGAVLIDADDLARAATRDPEVLRAISRMVGPDLVRDGVLDRAATARLVFDDPEARARLNGIVHPWVRRHSAHQRATLANRPSPPPIILEDIPLLYENGLDKDLDAVVVVTAPLEQRIARVRARSGLSEQEVRARDAAQWPLETKVARADYVVDNSGPVERLAGQLEQLWTALIKKAEGRDPSA